MSEIPVIKAALLGAGTVGGGVLRILEWQRDEMPKKLGVSIELKKILVRDKTKKREGIDSALLTEDWFYVLWNDQILDKEMTPPVSVSEDDAPSRDPDRDRGDGRHRACENLYPGGAPGR